MIINDESLGYLTKNNKLLEFNTKMEAATFLKASKLYELGIRQNEELKPSVFKIIRELP